MHRHGAEHAGARLAGEHAGLQQRGAGLGIARLAGQQRQPAADQVDGGEGTGIAKGIARRTGDHLQRLGQRVQAAGHGERHRHLGGELRIEHGDIGVQVRRHQQRAIAAQALATDRRGIARLGAAAGQGRHGDMGDAQRLRRRTGFQADAAEQHVLDVGKTMTQRVLDRLGRIQHTATAEGDDGVDLQRPCNGGRMVDAFRRGIGLDHADQRRLAAAPVGGEHRLQLLDQPGAAHARTGHQQRAAAAQLLHERRHPYQCAGTAVHLRAHPVVEISRIRHDSVPQARLCSRPYNGLARGSRWKAVTTVLVSR
ncbi:hypothetical protein D3C76_550670 [compost metagenome]